MSREPMSFFNEMPEQVKHKAYENLAYELLDDYIDNHEEGVEERLMQGLKNEKAWLNSYWVKWKEGNNE
jgi:hypothetical protein